MSIYIKDPATDKAIRTLAKRHGVSLTEAVRAAVEEKLANDRAKGQDRLAKLRELQAKVAQWPTTGLKADKAFYDWLSGEED